MRGLLGVLGVLGLGMIVGWGWTNAFSAQPPFSASRTDRPAATGGQMIAVPFDGPTRQLVLIDPARRVVAVYQIDPTNGTVTLKSVRNTRWDFELKDYNGSRPSPEEIEALIGQPKP